MAASVGELIASVQTVDRPDEQRVDIQIVLWSMANGITSGKPAWAGTIPIAYEMMMARRGFGHPTPLVLSPPPEPCPRRLRFGEEET